MDAKTFDDFIAAFNAHDLDRLLTFFADDAVYSSHSGTEPMGTVFTGRAAIRTALATRFSKSPDGQIVMTSPAIINGDDGASEWYFEFRDEQHRLGRVYGCDIFKFRGNKILVKNVYGKSQTPS